MDLLTTIVLGGAGVWALYWVMRSAVRDGLLDVAQERDRAQAERQPPLDTLA